MVRLGFAPEGMTARGKRPRAFAAVVAVPLVALLASCGGKDFKNDPRPPLPIELTGVIQPKKVTISPAKVGAGPVLITISNQTDDPHSVRLNGGSVDQQVARVGSTDTATIQKTLTPGTYEVSAGSATAVPHEIAPAKLTVGKPRASSSGDLSLP